VTARSDHLDRFYSLMDALSERCGGPRTLSTCSGASGWPERGVYFFFEPGEIRDDGVTPRVVRVGTHALRPSTSTLWGRLAQHRGNTGGSNPGGGNHRGSIFRLHVGTALLRTGDWPEPVKATWGVKSSADRASRVNEYALERAVSLRIGALPFLWLEVDDPPSSASERGIIEAGSIGLLSNLGVPAIDRPSPDWLGLSAARPAVNQSGLWNVNHVHGGYDPRFLDVLERRITAM
jgi:hypothetical protein